ncbi:NERD domain-containing protein [Paenibacillus melissococcoides]|uniref:NERD domain-containing protein n=1 Tax=Paenibacillus melissococcoides TaxID=2912268 RepID=A0ABM9G8C5_9BACL|nr:MULTISPECIES: nuclease-related domain-containing protein [Paenibacillus]MEB9897115.1 nuclease-related domain-containing protein [Bacillus cereus]CAH8248200.1 NERD domain-containing protein [Paenibacillus melissococcoides]CAH8718179.1 NERD domain-containing protein [Paenibacillus melissococcoides]CAH8718942.1 NERD domain-containing protein [Paenibacillus melissococcoides]GIO82342.1 hypothetical protein J6TS7_59520 [Paenibacillus dendritiformis]
MFKKLVGLFKTEPKKSSSPSPKRQPSKPKVESTRIGELGEHKINIQLDQLPKDCMHLADLMIPNPRSRTGYSQIDHVVVTPYGLFVIETKNYNGEIKGARTDKQWTVSNRFRMYNPLMQNYGHIKALTAILLAYPDLKFISLVSFTMRCRFSIDPELRKIHSDELVVYDVELSEFIGRKLTRLKAESAPTFNAEDVSCIHETIRLANIADPEIRRQHVEKIKSK